MAEDQAQDGHTHKSAAHGDGASLQGRQTVQAAYAQDLAVARAVLTGEADALNEMAAALGAEFSSAVDRIIRSSGRVICAGIGKSGHIARKIAATLASTGTPAYFVHPTEASHGDLGMIQADDVVLGLSRSGETAEFDDLVQYTRRFNVTFIVMTAKPGSTLGRAADIILQIPDAPEACADVQAPTTSTTLSIALGDALAVALLRRRGFDAAKFKMFHPGGKLGAMLKTAADLMQRAGALPVIEKGRPLADGLKEMSAKNLGCVGVVDGDGHLVGMVTDGDLRRIIVGGATPALIDEAMTPNPIVIGPEMLAASVLQIMNDKKITQIFVTQEGRPIGVIHMHDILKAGLV